MEQGIVCWMLPDGLAFRAIYKNQFFERISRWE
jgi:hypothetical protein